MMFRKFHEHLTETLNHAASMSWGWVLREMQNEWDWDARGTPENGGTMSFRPRSHDWKAGWENLDVLIDYIFHVASFEEEADEALADECKWMANDMKRQVKRLQTLEKQIRKSLKP